MKRFLPVSGALITSSLLLAQTPSDAEIRRVPNPRLPLTFPVYRETFALFPFRFRLASTTSLPTPTWHAL